MVDGADGENIAGRGGRNGGGAWGEKEQKGGEERNETGARKQFVGPRVRKRKGAPDCGIGGETIKTGGYLVTNGKKKTEGKPPKPLALQPVKGKDGTPKIAGKGGNALKKRWSIH